MGVCVIGYWQLLELALFRDESQAVRYVFFS